MSAMTPDAASTAEAPTSGGADGFGRGFLTDIWHFAALSRDVRPGRLKRLRMLGEPVALGRTAAGELFALRDICPHRAAPLSAGRIAREADGTASVECPYHGWRFGADGRCRAIPSLTEDQSFEIDRIRVRTYPVAESQGLVFVWFASDPRSGAGPDGPPPTFPGAQGAPHIALSMDLAAHLDHAVVGLMDPAHGPFVHQQWWWRSRRSMHAKAKRFEPTELGFRMARHAPSSNSRAYAALGGRPQTEITFRLPGLRWEHVQVGARQVLSLTCLTPVDAGATRITQMIWSDHPVFSLASPLIGLAAHRFLAQDAEMVLKQKEGLGHDPALLWIDDADRQARWYQALKREWSASRRERRSFVNPIQPTTLRWRS